MWKKKEGESEKEEIELISKCDVFFFSFFALKTLLCKENESLYVRGM